MQYLDRLLSNLYRSFDKAPGERVALRAQHPAGLAWRVADRRLSASTLAGVPLADIDLTATDMNGLADALEAVGCTISWRDLDLAGRQADVLLPGAGRQDESNGDALRCYTSPLWALLDSFSVAIEGASASVQSALLQSRMHTAEAEWLDYWGSHFGIVRGQRVLLGGDLGGVETDPQYLSRIVAEVLRPRVNKFAIEQAILDLAGEVVELYEPWNNIFILSESELSGDDRIHDGVYWTWNVIQPIVRGAASARDWDRILRVIERNRPIGTIVADPAWDADAFYGYVGASIAASFFAASVHGFEASSLVDPPLSAMILSDNEFSLNYEARIDHVLGLSSSPTYSDPGTQRAWTGEWDADTWQAKFGTLISEGCASLSIESS